MTVSPATSPASSSRYRWAICALLFWVTTANYIDRGVFSNLAPDLQGTIGWTQDQYWYMQVAFLAAYAVSNPLAGRLMDVIGLRWGFPLIVGFWGLAAMSHALVSTVAGFFLVRILLGLGEGGNFPAANKAVAEWFPKRERALAFSLFNSGSNLGGILVPCGLPLLLPLFARVTIRGHVLGWRGAFLVTGLVDLTWIIAWLRCYRKPHQHPQVSAEELALINSEPPEATVKIPWRRLLRHRQTWAFAAVKLTDCFWWFYLTGAPYFFADRFGLNLNGRSVPIAVIYVMSSFSGVAGGWLSGHFLNLGWSVNRARKTTMLLCAVAVLPVTFAAFTGSQWLAVGLITLACMAHQAWSANVMSLAGDMFPRRVIGSVTGLAGFAGSVAGIALFTCVGLVRQAAIARGEPGNYVAVFIVAGGGYLVALLGLHLLAPRLEPAPLDEKAVA
jgi:MFS transporter, ACS family, hexuronate transporter